MRPKLNQKKLKLLMSTGVVDGPCVAASGGQWPLKGRWKLKGHNSTIIASKPLILPKKNNNNKKKKKILGSFLGRFSLSSL